MAQDLIARFCQASPPRFLQPCEFFLPPRRCRLLQHDDFSAIFEQGRCDPYELLRIVAAATLQRYADLLDPQEYVDSFTFELFKKLEHCALTERPTLPALKAYCNTAVGHAVIDLLENLHLLTPKTCGYCIHLSRSSPPRCLLQYVEHQSARGTLRRTHRWHGKTRTPSGKACRDGFEPYSFDPLAAIGHPSTSPVAVACDLQHVVALLEVRAEQAQGRKAKQICRRQLAIFTELFTLLSLGYSRKEAVNEVLAVLTIQRKMLHRDLKEIEAFLIEKNVL